MFWMEELWWGATGMGSVGVGWGFLLVELEAVVDFGVCFLRSVGSMDDAFGVQHTRAAADDDKSAPLALIEIERWLCVLLGILNPKMR